MLSANPSLTDKQWSCSGVHDTHQHSCASLTSVVYVMSYDFKNHHHESFEFRDAKQQCVLSVCDAHVNRRYSGLATVCV